MKWFKHDSCANMDAKLQDVLLDYGLEGYGLYWYCIELISSKVSKNNITFSLEHDARIIARNTGSTSQRVQEMMSRFVDLGLFESSSGYITCFKLAKRIDQSMTSNPEMRQIIEEIKQNHDGVMTKSGKVMQDQIRSDQIRSDKTKKETANRRFTPPTVEEVKQYCQERLNFVDPQEFIDHYEANGWMRGKSKVKDWKACVRTWEKNAKPKNNQYSSVTAKNIETIGEWINEQ